MTITWRKSSLSGGENSACVEIANTLGAVRDSKNTGPVLGGDIRELLAAIKIGRLNR